MKLKLKVSKSLKRSLKMLSQAKELERTDFIIAELIKHLDDNTSIWENKTEAYVQVLKERQEGLNVLKDSFTEDILATEKRNLLKAYYTEHKMYRDVISKNKKMENIIINLNDTQYYGMMMLAENREVTIEAYTVQFLHTLNNHA